jgi:hypothetical protein
VLNSRADTAAHPDPPPPGPVRVSPAAGAAHRLSGRAAAGVEPALESDVPQVARLHRRVFYHSTAPASAGLEAYYREVFFRNPWRCDDLPSLVCRGRGGEVIGFMGRIPRRMLLHNCPIQLAIAHRLMVAPDSGDPLAALRLVRTFLAGPQDLSVSDGANDSGRRFWEASGGTTSPLYSMGWLCPLRPSRYLLGLLGGRPARRIVGTALWPLWEGIDRCLSRRWRMASGARPGPFLEREMDPATLLRCLVEVSADSAIRPQYDASSVEWLWAQLAGNTHRGHLCGKALLEPTGCLAGGFLSYVRGDGMGEVLLLAARPGRMAMVLSGLLHDARQRRLVGLKGRVDPHFLVNLMEQGCLLKRNSWGLVHSRVPEIRQALARHDAFLSGLEGELWLRSPRDGL